MNSLNTKVDDDVCMCVPRHPNILLSLDSLTFSTTAKAEESLEVGKLDFTLSGLKSLSNCFC